MKTNSSAKIFYSVNFYIGIQIFCDEVAFDRIHISEPSE